MYGPVVLAGITDDPFSLKSVNPDELVKHIKPRSVDDFVSGHWHCISWDKYVQFISLNEVNNERYTVYFRNKKL